MSYAACSFSLAPARIPGRLAARPRYVVSRYTVSLANPPANLWANPWADPPTTFLVDRPRPAKPAGEGGGDKTPDFNKNLGNQGYAVIMADFADLCLASPRPAVRPLRGGPSLRLSADPSDDAMSAPVGIVNSVLIGALFWIGVLAVISLI